MKEENQTNDSPNMDITALLETEVKAVGLEFLGKPAIVDNAFLVLSFFDHYDASDFLNIASGKDHDLHERIQQKSEDDNWDYLIKSVGVPTEDVDRPEYFFFVMMFIPLSDARLLLKNLVSHNKTLTKSTDKK